MIIIERKKEKESLLKQMMKSKLMGNIGEFGKRFHWHLRSMMWIIPSKILPIYRKQLRAKKCLVSTVGLKKRI